jgi:hypothetical protein
MYRRASTTQGERGIEMPGLTDDEKKYILECESNIVALRFLQARKSQLAIRAARWKDIYQAQLEGAELQKRIADLDDARRKVIIIAITGVVSCAGGWIITGARALAGGYAYTSFSMAAPIVATSVESGGFTISTAVLLSESLSSRIGWFALKTAVFGAPAGFLLKKAMGDSAVSLALNWVFEKSGYGNAKAYSKEEFSKQKDLFLAEGIGDERFRRLISDPSARDEEIKQAIQQIVEKRVAEYITVTLMSVDPPINMMMLMTDTEFADWYEKFREDVTGYIQKQYASWSRENRAILQNRLLWDFWNKISADLNELDMKWNSDAKNLQRSINDTVLSMRRVLGMMHPELALDRR